MFDSDPGVFDFEKFCQQHWIEPNGSCQRAPWLDSSFVQQLEESARQALNYHDFAWLSIFCRSQEKLAQTPVMVPADILVLTRLWIDPVANGADIEEDDRISRLQQAVKQKLPREHVMLPTLLELVRPSRNLAMSTAETNEITEALKCSNGDLQTLFKFLLTFRQQGENGWTKLAEFSRGKKSLTVEEIRTNLDQERQLFVARTTELWSAAGGKVHQTHCRRAWAQFVDKHVASVKQQLAPANNREDFRTWNFDRLNCQIKDLSPQHARIANDAQAFHTDRKAMDKAVIEIIDRALKILQQAKDCQKKQDSLHFHGMECPVKELNRLINGPELPDPTEEICRLTLKILIDGHPVENSDTLFSITEIQRWKCPDLLTLLGNEKGGSRAKWEKFVSVETIDDPVRAAAIVLSGEGYSTMADKVLAEGHQNLRVRLIETHRTDLLPFLVESDQLDTQEKTRVHREENERLEKVHQSIKHLEQIRLHADALALASAGQIERVYQSARDLFHQPQQVHQKLTLMASWLQSIIGTFSEELDQAVENLRSKVEAIPDGNLRNTLIAKLKVHRYGHVLQELHNDRFSHEMETDPHRETIWRREAEIRFHNPFSILSNVSDDHEASELVKPWIEQHNQGNQESARKLRRVFYDFISGEAELSTSRKRVMIPDGLREIGHAKIQIDCVLLLNLMRQERLNPTFMPQLRVFSKLVIMSPPRGVTAVNAPTELSRSVGVERNREGLVVFLFPGLPAPTRERVLSEFRRRDLRGTIIDDVDLCRLAGLDTDHKPHGFLGLIEIILEQLNWRELSPYQSRDGQFIQLEMFVGREQEAEKLAKTAEYTRVFSGRKLGKSALLKYIENTYNETPLPSGNELRVFYIIVAGGESEQWLTDRVIDEIRKRFAQTPEVTDEDPGQRLSMFLTEFLKIHKTISLLIILDEADAFVEGQLKRYDDVRERCLSFRMMKEVHGGTDKNDLPRVRFVFSGYRVTNTREGAWANAGAILRLTALTELEAVRLVEGPLSRMGIDVREQAATIARHCGFQPAIIIRFCDNLLKQVQLTHAAASQREVHISHEDVVNCFHQASVQEEIRTINDNNFQGNRVGRIIFWAMLMAFNDLLPGTGLENATENLLRRIREIDSNTGWLRKLDPSETGEILRNLNDFRDRELIDEYQQSPCRAYRMKFPAHLPVLMTEEDPENQIRKDIQRVRDTGPDPHFITNLLSPNQLDEIRFALESSKRGLDVTLAVAGSHWTEALQKDRGGIPDRLDSRPADIVDAKDKSLSIEALVRRQPLLVINATANIAQQIVELRPKNLGVPLLIGGADLLRWAIDIVLRKEEGLVSFVGLNRIDKTRITWFYERLRMVNYENPDAITRIIKLTGGIPALLAAWDRLLPTGYEIDLDMPTFENICQQFAKQLEGVARALSGGDPTMTLTPRERQLLRMVSSVAIFSGGDTFNLREELAQNWEILYADKLPKMAPLHTDPQDDVAVTMLREIGMLPLDGRGDVHLPIDDALHQLVKMMAT